EQGSWESGLSYECRSLLFKALHNLIERCLLSRDFVRLGKWFVQPYNGYEKHRCSSSHLSFSFAFFVHGESTVCASVDVRQHPAVRHLTKTCLQRTQTSQSGVKVILAPYGLAGTLTGQVSRMDSQLLEEWKHFYPISTGSNPETGLPPLVEVLVGGVRMRYPSCYVLVTDMDDTPPETPLSPPSSPVACERPLLTQQELSAATELPERVWAECTLSSPVSASKTESSTEPETWTFVEPTQKSSCTCSCSKYTTPGGWKSLASSQIQRERVDKGGRRVVPFHRRSTTQWDTCPSVPANAPRSVLSRTEAPSTPPGGPPSYSRGPPTGGDCLPVPSVGSPGSPAPSPLLTPHSEPASVPPAEPTMPTLSPQPPPSHTNTAPPLTPSQGPKSISSACNNQVHSPSVPGPILKRPVLASREYEGALLDDEQPLSWLYDYSLQEAWLNHPVKRFKATNTAGPPINRSNILYPPINSQTLQASQAPKLEIKQEPVSVAECIGRRTDPYEFDATGEENGTNVDGLRRQRDDPSKPGSLFTSEGLQPSYKDLDQIFDNSDADTSSDETNLNQLQIQTPPGSNKSGGLHEETRIDGTNKNNNRGVTVLRPEELSKMFPTPPSLEHNPVASPCQLSDPLIDQTELLMPTRPLRHLPDIYPNMGSPQEEPIDDWSYVFKPAAICKMVGSSNPAPPYRSATLPGRPPPPPYDQPSPATSTTSSYLNKNLNSIEADTPGPARAPESNSLIVNILLGDTALNIFRDHNFDSCSLCVCNAGPKVVGNIKGADAGVYLSNSWAGSALFQDDDPIRCSCGFSAVVNRRLAHRAGLFYEDEMEITGVAEDPAEKKKGSLATAACPGAKATPDGLDIISPNVLELLREQCLIVQSSASSLYRAARICATTKSYPTLTPTVNTLEFNDGNEVCVAALDQGKLDGAHNERVVRVNGVHRWVFLRARGPQCSGDIVRMMRSLQPLLQDAVQKKCTTRMWEAPYTVAGPLTWRQFHRLAGRGTDDRCEPQPIPALVVGYDRDWLSLSPYAICFWEKLSLEPFAGPRDVAYVVVAPDSDCIINRVKSFFRELSCTYEICRLGRHTPISKQLRDGILRVGKSTAQKLAKQPMDEWFKFLGENHLGELLRLYAQVCNHRLAPYLTQVIQDRSLLDPADLQSSNKQQQQSTIPVPDTMPATPDVLTTTKPESVEGENPRSETPSSTSTATNQTATTTGNTTPTSQTTNSTTPITTTTGPDEEEIEPPAIVVYFVEPFSLGGTEDPDRRRLAILALLRAYSSAINSMPENMRSNIHVQIISLESIMELGRARERRKIQDEMRALALNVFLQGRRLLNHNSTVKSLTGFGTAAAADLFLKSKDSFSNTLATIHQERNKAPYRLYAPAFVLAPLRAKSEAPESFGMARPEECAVLYLSYCLSEDQSWLLAAATDDRGEIFETATINIDIPNRKRRKRASARRIGLQKLMDFILSIMSQGVQPWRLVVGRVGRIGHGELKGWSWLLSRKALLKASKHLKEICGQCSLLYPSAAPCVLSACLVSLEPDSTLRLMADQFTPDERFSQASVNCQLSTPQDVTCTHILVFPTSATTQSSQTAFQEQHNVPELGDDELFSALNDDMPEGMEGMGDFNDIFNVWPEPGAGGGQSPNGSPHRPEGSPHGGDGGGSGLGNHDGPGSPFPCSNTPRIAIAEQTEEVGTLLQQPLALGYLVSTAPTGRMPPWFWAACPHLENVCPVFLKNALHLHSPAIQQNSDDLLQQQSAPTAHPYVLEGYNALSWLALDANTKDRLSCLPVHVQALMHLYHATAALV
ncbi:Mediator of RNA polymerase II transcription subunit 13, partial [Camponotus floridanus]